MSEIKDGLFAYVGGTVERAFHSKTGIAAVVAVQSPKKQYPDRVTVWGISDSIGHGDRIKVKGWLSWTVTKKDDGTTYVNVSLNSPEIVAHENVGQVTEAQVAADIVGAPVLDDAPF